jgi:hypothetical protein
VRRWLLWGFLRWPHQRLLLLEADHRWFIASPMIRPLPPPMIRPLPPPSRRGRPRLHEILVSRLDGPFHFRHAHPVNHHCLVSLTPPNFVKHKSAVQEICFGSREHLHLHPVPIMHWHMEGRMSIHVCIGPGIWIIEQCLVVRMNPQNVDGTDGGQCPRPTPES